MNLYFWLFLLCALLMTPIGAQVHIRVGHGVYYRILLRTAGLPVMCKNRQEESDVPLRSGDVMKGVKGWDYKLLIGLVRQGHFARILHLFDWRDAEIRARISFEDAALTAMVYALIRTALQTWSSIHPIPVRGYVEMDFHGQGTQIAFRCIATAYLGSLMAAAIRLWVAAAAYRAERSSAEEETYAAASH